MSDREKQIQFRLDVPIDSLVDDLLGRKRFARELAKILGDSRSEFPFVVALYGSWGSGKTSLINMVMEVFRETPDESPVVVSFNPWHWENQTQIIDAFFKELEKSIWENPLGQSKKDAVRALRKFAKTLGAISHAAGGLDRLSKWMIVIASGLGVSSVFNSPLGATTMAIVAGLALFYQEVLAWFGELFERVSGQIESGGEKTLDERREDVDKKMRELSKRILIVIDDIDRLRAEQIRQVLQVVKVNANFPNVTYLLLFQRDIVEHALIDGAHIGREFLDKIVQFGIDLPQIERQRLEKVLTDGLENLLNPSIQGPDFDQDRWVNVFSSFRRQFKTLRDVYRYLSTLAFHVELMREGGTFEVNTIDLVALEAIRLFQPNVYRKLAGYKDVITGVVVDTDGRGTKRERLEKALEDLLADVPSEHRSDLTELLGELFPIVSWVAGKFSSTPSPEDRADFERDIRVCSRALFDKYFLLALPLGDFPQWRIEYLIRNSSSHDNLVREFEELIAEELIGPALDRLASSVDRLPIANTEAVCLALFNVADNFPVQIPGFAISPNLFAERLISSLLRRDPSEESRATVLMNALTMSRGLSLPCQIVSGETNRSKRREPSQGYLLAEKSTPEMIEVCLRKIRRAAEQVELQRAPELQSILYDWKMWSPSDEASTWVAKRVTTPFGALEYLKSIVQRPVRSSGRKTEVLWYIRLNYIEDFVPLSLFSEKLAAMRTVAASDVDRAVLKAFEETMARKAKGEREPF